MVSVPVRKTRVHTFPRMVNFRVELPEDMDRLLDFDDLLGLVQFAEINGPDWKDDLAHSWAVSGSPALASVRDKIGPSGLARIEVFVS